VFLMQLVSRTRRLRTTEAATVTVLYPAVHVQFMVRACDRRHGRSELRYEYRDEQPPTSFMWYRYWTYCLRSSGHFFFAFNSTYHVGR
jgi:hypothetical protein